MSSHLDLLPFSTILPTETAADLAHLAPPPMLIEHLIPQGSITLIAGPTYSGKTFFAMELARAVAFNKPFMGHFPTIAPGNVLFIEQDSPKYDTGRAFWLMIKRDYSDLSGSVEESGEDPRIKCLRFLWHKGLDLKQQTDTETIIKTTNSLFTSTGLEWVEYPDDNPEQIISGYRGCTLIVLDTFRDLHTAEENSSTEMAVIMKRIKQIREYTKAAILLIHHGPKDPMDLLGVRGSTAIEGAVDTIFRITSNQQTKLSTIAVKKARAIKPQDFAFQVATFEDPVHGMVKEVRYAGDVKSKEPKEQTTPSHHLLRNYIQSHPGLSNGELGRWGPLNGQSSRTVTRNLEKLVADNEIRKERTKVGRKSNVRYFPLDTPASQE